MTSDFFQPTRSSKKGCWFLAEFEVMPNKATVENVWTEEKIRALLQAEDFTYQKIQLPFGITTPGHDRSFTCQKIYPENMQGKTVLDIGSKYGYFCFEALRRGASSAVGIDLSSEYIRKSKLLAEILGVKAEFRLQDIEISETVNPGVFDYVLCLNVLHHLSNPLSVLDNLIRMTRDRLILEVAALGRHDRKKMGAGLLETLFFNRLPAMFIRKNSLSNKPIGQRFFFTESGIRNLLLYNHCVFSHVDFHKSEMKDRYIAVAHKRQIGKLLMIAGPTAAGKSTLVEKLRHGEFPEIINKLRLGGKEMSEWVFSAPALLENLSTQKIDHLIYHYDILLPHKHQIGDHFKDNYLDILNTATQKSIITIWAPPDRLRQQFADSEIRGRKKVKKANLRLMKEYEDPGKVIAFYREWIHFVKSLNVEHWIADFSDGVRFYSPQEWEAMALQITN